MNPSDYTTFETTTTAVDETRCNFMYGQQPGAWNVCELRKGHYGHHHDGRTGVSWSNTLTYQLNTTGSAT